MATSLAPAQRSGLPSARGRRRAAVRLAAAYAVGLALLVLTPISEALLALTVEVGRVWSALGLPGDPAVPDTGAVLNVVLFVPLGWALVSLTRRPWWVAASVALLVSVGIETVQLLPALHRDATAADVLANGLGGLVGALGAMAFARVRPVRARIPQQATQQAPRVPAQEVRSTASRGSS